MLESYKHPKNAFVTLTYKPEKLPEGGTLVKADYQKFFKKLRKISPFRYYICGEYGEKDQRPHYHIALFGLGPEDAEKINSAWSNGFSFVGDLTHDSAQYVAGYVTKKMTHPESKCTDKCRHPPLNGRLPEFSRMSLRPGIGATAVDDIADVLTSEHGCDALARVGDVPHALMMAKKSIPLGRYIRGKLREKLNFPDKKTPPEHIEAWNEEMRKLRKDYESEKGTSALSKYLDKTQHFKQWLIEKNQQKVLQLEKKNAIYSVKRNKL